MGGELAQGGGELSQRGREVGRENCGGEFGQGFFKKGEMK